MPDPTHAATSWCPLDNVPRLVVCPYEFCRIAETCQADCTTPPAVAQEGEQ